ncbi:MAG: hydrolase 2, exosortase A system-associated [Rubrivivax sp.]|nr:hydrolase 2, exosortase A system-associated [Rubrivivax sp.]
MNPRPTAVEAFYLAAPAGQRFCLYRAPVAGPVAGGVLYVHPFAEEMNKSRRMAALQARALAAAGYGVLQIDLHGCGDSSGDFADATWKGWVDDVVLAWSWLTERCAGATRWMWGLRAGCLLAAAASHAMSTTARPERFLFWQPPAKGQTLLQQFMRLRLAADSLRREERSSAEPASPDVWRQGTGQARRPDKATDEPAGDAAIEVAGYALHPQLRAGLGACELGAPQSPTVQALWFETTLREAATLLPATQHAAERWRLAGHLVRTEVVNGSGFWQTQEIAIAPNLVEATTRAVCCLDATEPA